MAHLNIFWTRLLQRCAWRVYPVRNYHLLLKTGRDVTARRTVSASEQCCRCAKTASQHLQDSAPKNEVASQDFTSIYTFRYIVHTRVLSRLKIYQTLLTVGALPPSVYFHSAGHLSTPNLFVFIGIASLATVMLYVMSSFFRRVVGIIYVNKTLDVVRISHLTFWGQRRDVEFWTSDIVPLTDAQVNPNDAYQVIKFYDQPERFYWFLKHGKNTNRDAIEHIFGKIYST